jgi:membrane-bound ClpP family serine protease
MNPADAARAPEGPTNTTTGARDVIMRDTIVRVESSSPPGVCVGLGTIVPAALGFAVVFLFLGRLALTAQLQPPVTGAHGLVGQLARVRTPLLPSEPGLVDMRGEIWRAVSLVPLPPGHPVRVSRVEGLTLTVEPADLTAPKGAD